jgi:glucosylceramidase
MRLLFSTLGFLLALAVLPTKVNTGNPCEPRQFNHDSIVCVCTEDYCDSLDPIYKTYSGIVKIFESSRAGKRLESREVSFNNTLEGGSNYWNVVVDRAQAFQEIIGFGGSWSDAAGISIGRMSEKLKTSILRSYYSEEGIEYSTARVVVGGSDFSTRLYSLDDTAWDWDLAHWSLAEEDTLYKVRRCIGRCGRQFICVACKFMQVSVDHDTKPHRILP